MFQPSKADLNRSRRITNIESVGSVLADLARGFYKLFGPLLGIIETKHPDAPRAFSGKRKSPDDRKPRRGARWSDAHRHQYIEGRAFIIRSAEHTSELQSLMRISYAVL